MLNDLNSVVSFVFSTLTSVWALVTAGNILTGAVVLWLVKKVSHLFDKLK